MKRLFAGLMLLLMVSCEQEVKPTSEDSEIAVEAFALAESLRAGYVKKDFSGLSSLMTESGYAEAQKEFGAFDSVELVFTPRLVEIEEERVILNVSWQGTWKHGDNTKTDKGMAVFELTERPFKLNRVLRGSPFRYP